MILNEVVEALENFGLEAQTYDYAPLFIEDIHGALVKVSSWKLVVDSEDNEMKLVLLPEPPGIVKYD